MDKKSSFDRNKSDRKYTDSKGLNVYGEMSSTEKRNDLVKKNLKLVNFIVSRLAIGLPSHVDRRDLVSSGVIGLIDAANHFDPKKGVKFETYASTRIKGAIIDELRALDWIPRSTREKSKEVEKTILSLIGKLGRFPNDKEIADKLDWDMDKYYKTMDQISGTALLSLDEIIATTTGGDNIKRIDLLKGDTESPLKDIERRELADKIVKIIGGLSEQEKLVIALYYYEELTLKEIGMVLKVSESRVSQIHTTAILKIRARLSSVYSET